MRIFFVLLSFLLLGFMSGCQIPLKDSEGYTHLFNGKDFKGWRATFGPGSFKIVDDIMVVNSTGNGPHLVYVGEGFDAKFKDFELIVEAKADPSSNSGIYFHTDGTSRSPKGWLYSGYEAQLNTTAKEKRKTGSLYAVQDVAESPVDETDWFTMKIRVKDKRIQIWCNDVQTVDYTEPENPVRKKNMEARKLSPDGGYIAVQAHDVNSTWYFRTIKIKEL